MQWNMVIKKKTMIKKSLKIFVIVDIGVILICLFLGTSDWLINTQIAFLSSLIVTIGSYLGYEKNVQKRVSDHVNEDDTYDEVDKMDDKYDLYSPQITEVKVNENPTKDKRRDNRSYETYQTKPCC